VYLIDAARSRSTNRQGRNLTALRIQDVCGTVTAQPQTSVVDQHATVREFRSPEVDFSMSKLSPCRSLAAVALSLLVVAACTADPEPTTAPGWTPVWSDDFASPAGSGLSPTNWFYDIGTGYPGGAAGWGTREVETVIDRPRMSTSTATATSRSCRCAPVPVRGYGRPRCA
jgi:hypothetical protein